MQILQQANLTTYSIYYAEKRPFFLDGASYFKSNLFELLYTRTIAEPNIGAKLTGKTGFLFSFAATSTAF